MTPWLSGPSNCASWAIMAKPSNQWAFPSKACVKRRSCWASKSEVGKKKREILKKSREFNGPRWSVFLIKSVTSFYFLKKKGWFAVREIWLLQFRPPCQSINHCTHFTFLRFLPQLWHPFGLRNVEDLRSAAAIGSCSEAAKIFRSLSLEVSHLRSAPFTDHLIKLQILLRITWTSQNSRVFTLSPTIMGSVENYHPSMKRKGSCWRQPIFHWTNPSKGSRLKGAFLQLQVAHYEMGRQTSQQHLGEKIATAHPVKWWRNRFLEEQRSQQKIRKTIEILKISKQLCFFLARKSAKYL